ncbi:Uncharacterised protein [Mycobacteroides abscessus subsp. abscessus]|nr:Uncharacterised protein [Mycobacteroides abscessus subsp. abscessus]
MCAPPRNACASTANSPPTQTAAATRCRIRLLVATSCEPPEAECPVNASGIMVRIEPPNSTGVQPQRSASRAPTATISANTTVVRQASAMSTCPIARHSCSGRQMSATGWPVVSDTVSGTSSAAQTAHARAKFDPIRTAR